MTTGHPSNRNPHRKAARHEHPHRSLRTRELRRLPVFVDP